MLFPVFLGGEARLPGKELGEIFAVRIAHGPGDLIELLFRLGQELFRASQPQFRQTLVDGLSAALLVGGAQVGVGVAQLTGYVLHGQGAVRVSPDKDLFHPGGNVRLFRLCCGKVVPGGLEQDAPELLRRLLLHGGVQQEVRLPGDRRHVAGFRRVEEKEYDLAVDMAQILLIQLRTADQIPVEAAQSGLRFLLLPVPDQTAQLGQAFAVLRRPVRSVVTKKPSLPSVV